MLVKERYRLLYDGACPICSREVLWLHRRRPEAIEAVDIAAKDFDADIYGLTAHQVDAALYGIRPDGSVTVGMDSLREAYRLGRSGLADELDRLVASSPSLQRLLPLVRPQPHTHRQTAGAPRRLRRQLPVLMLPE